MIDVNRAWLAGIVEGEGWIGYDMHRRTVRLSIEMTDRDVIERAAKLIGVRSFSTRKRKGCKDTYQINASGRKAEAALVLIYPYLGKRRKIQANKALLAGYRKKFIKTLDKTVKMK